MKGLRQFIRGFFLRQTADGKTRWDGFGFYLVVVIVIFWVGYRIIRPKAPPGPTQSGLTPKRESPAKVETERANQASATFTPVAPLRSTVQNPLTLSERTVGDARASESRSNRQTKPESGQDGAFLDTVRMASQQRLPRSTSKNSDTLPNGFIDEGDAGLRAERVPAGNQGAAAPVTGTTAVGAPISVGQPLQVPVGAVDPNGLVVYKRTSGPVVEPAKPSGFQTNHFLPLGHEIPVIFTDKVLTLDLEGLVRFQVAGNVVFNGRLQIPHGTFIYATASKKNVADRVAFTVHTVVWKDGSQTSLSGIAKDPDGQAGVMGYYIPRPAEADALGYLAPVALGFIESQKRTMTSQQIGAGGTIQNIQQANPYDFRNEMLGAGQNGLQDQLRRQQDELDRRYQPYVEIRAGSTAVVQLTAAVDLDMRSNAVAKRAASAAATSAPESPSSLPLPVALKNALPAVLGGAVADKNP